MNGDASPGFLTDGEEPFNDAVVGGGAIDEEQILVVETRVRELLGFVHALVEADDGGDAVRVEVVEIVIWRVQGVPVLDAALVVRAGKG